MSVNKIVEKVQQDAIVRMLNASGLSPLGRCAALEAYANIRDTAIRSISGMLVLGMTNEECVDVVETALAMAIASIQASRKLEADDGKVASGPN